MANDIVILGGSAKAADLAERYLNQGKRVAVVTPVPSEPMQRLFASQGLKPASTFSASLLEGCQTVVTASDNAWSNRLVGGMAKRRGIQVIGPGASA